MPSPIHLTMMARLDGDQIVIAPIGWESRIKKQVFDSSHEALQTLLRFHKATGFTVIWMLGRSGGKI
ncbi:MAG: hypothetical protein AAFX40_18465 [Cyanobacteria bacterium J06639_1]